MWQSAGSGQVSLIKKIYQVTGPIRDDSVRIGFQVEHYRVFLGLGSFQIGPGWVSGFYELRSFRASGSVRGQILGHLISDSLGFRVGPGRAGLGSFLSCFISGRVKFQVGLDFGSLDLNLFFN
jgi:hypothetical protein